MATAAASSLQFPLQSPHNTPLPNRNLTNKPARTLSTTITPLHPRLTAKSDGRPASDLRNSAVTPHPNSSVGFKKEKIDEESLNLDGIRHSLIRQEDSIIFSLLERSNYYYNVDTYNEDVFKIAGFRGSLIEYMLRETEILHAQVRKSEIS